MPSPSHDNLVALIRNAVGQRGYYYLMGDQLTLLIGEFTLESEDAKAALRAFAAPHGWDVEIVKEPRSACFTPHR